MKIQTTHSTNCDEDTLSTAFSVASVCCMRQHCLNLLHYSCNEEVLTNAALNLKILCSLLS